MTTASKVIDRAAAILSDDANLSWSREELLAWLNDGRREMAVLRPDLYVVTEPVTLVAGSDQTLPAHGFRLMEIPRNTTGPAVTLIDRSMLDLFNPSWRTGTASTTVVHYTYDERDPYSFTVYPPAAPGAQVDVMFAKRVTDIAEGVELTAENDYISALVDFICFRAYSKDTEFAGNGQRALVHLQAFSNLLMGGRTKDMAISPNTNEDGGDRPTGAE